MDLDNGEHLFLGINKEGDLVSLELNFNDLNKGTEHYNPHYYLSSCGFSEIKDEETGKREARERLEDSEYWGDLGYLKQSKDYYNPVLNHIDFSGLADEVLSNDGWYMTNGEFYYIGLFDDKQYYINLQWCGHEHKELFSKKWYKTLFVNKEDFELLSSIKEIKEKDEKKVNELKKVFSKYQDKQKIIKSFLEEKE